MRYSIAIDGPAGVGKSTIAKEIASKKHLIYVDTGALYRGLAVYFLSYGLNPENEQEIAKSLDGAEVDLRCEEDGCHVILCGRDVTDKLRTEEVSAVASVTSRYPKVREKLLDLQRNLAKNHNVIMDGRDIGTVVLPDAQVKIFLTARPEVRAKRRYLQLTAEGRLDGRSLSDIEKNMKERDERDTTRKTAPLKPAEDAVIVDTSDMTIAEVENRIIGLLEEKVGR